MDRSSGRQRAESRLVDFLLENLVFWCAFVFFFLTTVFLSRMRERRSGVSRFPFPQAESYLNRRSRGLSCSAHAFDEQEEEKRRMTYLMGFYCLHIPPFVLEKGNSYCSLSATSFLSLFSQFFVLSLKLITAGLYICRSDFVLTYG